MVLADNTLITKNLYTMKKLFLLFVASLTMLFVGCSQFDDSRIWDAIDELEDLYDDLDGRLEKLEEECQKMNTNIEALQTLVTALQNHDTITSIAPIKQGDEIIGYTITFSQSEPITIYHGADGKDGADGEDGKDGADGKDGYTPTIGVAQDEDGAYYWTLDGEWLLDENGNKIKAVGEDGKDGANGNDGANGENGTNGENGENGKDGITPQLEIRDGYWYISYDNGATWKQLGKATGEDGKDGADGEDGKDGEDGEDGTNGTDGQDGKDGDSLFQSVTWDEEYAYFTLADGTVIKIPLASDSEAEEGDLPPANEIWYTSTDGEVVTPYNAAAFGVNILSNTYENGVGIITFDGDVTSIGNYAFSGCSSLTSITIPEGVTSIGDHVFDWCHSLKSVTISDSVTSIGDGAFTGCYWPLSVHITDIATWCRISSNYKFKDWGGNIPFNDYKLFLNGTLVTDLIIPNDVTSIGDYAFANCISLTSVTIGDGVTSIGVYAFGDCSSLTSITIPESVTSIEYRAFMNCSSLASITIPDSVTSIGEEAFAGCSSLTSITIPESVTSIGIYAFYGCSSLTSITIPESVTTIGEGAFANCISLTSVTIGNGVTKIWFDAFHNCTSLTSFYGKYASEDGRCLIIDGLLKSFAPAGLTEYTIPESVTSIGSYAFSDCSSLASITIPDSVTSIGNSAFSCLYLEAPNNQNYSEITICKPLIINTF